MAGSLAPVMYWAVRTTLCDATLQDALYGADVKSFEDLRTDAKSFQFPEGE